MKASHHFKAEMRRNMIFAGIREFLHHLAGTLGNRIVHFRLTFTF